MDRPNFNGDNAALAESINALLALDKEGKLSTALPGLARQLLAASVERLVQPAADNTRLKRLEEFALWVKDAPVSSGVCCCGNDMKAGDHHGDHSALDEWDHSLSNWLKELGLVQ